MNTLTTFGHEFTSADVGKIVIGSQGTWRVRKVIDAHTIELGEPRWWHFALAALREWLESSDYFDPGELLV